jgi:hypothetical protein
VRQGRLSRRKPSAKVALHRDFVAFEIQEFRISSKVNEARAAINLVRGYHFLATAKN